MIILDIDNTISDDAWRKHLIAGDCADPWAKYHTYHMLSGFDAVKNEHLFHGKKDVSVFTSRPYYFAPLTIEWLHRAGLENFDLYMRPQGVTCASPQLKASQLQLLFGQKNISASDIECAYDDRADVVQMYTDNGVRAERIFINTETIITRDLIQGAH